jgi:hypothetical protein
MGYAWLLEIGTGAGEFQEMLEERRLAVAPGAMALSITVGLSIRTMPQENRLMGETRDELVEHGQEAMQEAARKVQAVVQETIGAAKEEARHQFSEG